jgi:hypothetical protein
MTPQRFGKIRLSYAQMAFLELCQQEPGGYKRPGSVFGYVGNIYRWHRTYSSLWKKGLVHKSGTAAKLTDLGREVMAEKMARRERAAKKA